MSDKIEIELGDVLAVKLNREKDLFGQGGRDRILYIIERRQRLVSPVLFVGLDLGTYENIIFCADELDNSTKRICHYGIQEMMKNKSVEKLAEGLEKQVTITQMKTDIF